LNKQKSNSQRKRNFFLSADLDNKINDELKATGISFSQLVRDLLADWVKKREKLKVEYQIMDACEFYYDVDKKNAGDWRSAESEV